MSSSVDRDLSEWLDQAEAAGVADRINYRNPIAAYGGDAIVALEPWLNSDEFAAFAIRTIAQAGKTDPDLAVSVLQNAWRTATPLSKEDIRFELEKLGYGVPSASRRKPSPSIVLEPMEVDDLQREEIYQRSELHARGLGGNRRKGISYPADGAHVLLFSNKANVSETGYQDRWDRGDAYWYYGEWDGDGDMRLEKGNQRIIERGRDLHLFTATDGAYRYEGRFEYDSYSMETTKREGLRATAIVFHLVRFKP